MYQHIGTLGEMSPLLVKRLFAVFDKGNIGTVDQHTGVHGPSLLLLRRLEGGKHGAGFTVHDVDNDGYLVSEKLGAMLRAYVIGTYSGQYTTS